MIKREHYLTKLRQLKDMNVIKIVTGVRRCGKSTLLAQFRRELKESGGIGQNIIAFNLEEKENEQFTKDPNLLYDTILNLAKEHSKNYVFIDEIQSVPEFEKVIDSLFTKDNIDLYITGSNAYMTSSELATLLSGRYVEIKMQPLTFSEFLQFFPENNDKIARFQQFMQFGGFPEVANFLAANAKSQIPLYLRGIYQTVFEKDIKTHKQIRNIDDFRNVVLYIFGNIGNLTSPNNIANVLRAQNQIVNKQTVDNYLEAMQDCFILYGTKRFDIRGKKVLQTLEKYYTIDLGFTDVIMGRPSNVDLGHRLENVVYLELLKRYGQVWVGKNYEKEIDFVVKDADGMTQYFQVAQTAVEQKTLSREISAFENTGDHYQKTLLTLDVFETNENGLRRKNVIDWLVE